ncbi:MAG: SDR family oxidoreductase [Psychrobium sp.]|nr:SDR family oxidoreductase [Psychrobium sp.]
MKRVLVAGSTGYLGKFIIQNLVDKGIRPVALARSSTKLEQFQQNINIFEAELTNAASLINCCEGIDVVISSLGITRQQDGLSYMDVDYQANLNLLTEAKRSGVKKFIYVSAFHGDKLKHLKIFEAKEKFVKQLSESGLDYCVVRPTGFFSDMTELYNMANKGRVYLFGDGGYKSNPIHGDDLAEVCIGAIDSVEKEISVGGPEMFTQVELANIAFEAVGKPVKITFIPDWVRSGSLKLCKLLLNPNKFGPIEFFLNVLVMDMTAPKFGVQTLSRYFKSLNEK